MTRIWAVVLFVLAMFAVSVPQAVPGMSTTAEAAELSFRIKSNYRYKVQIEFYAQGRKAAWPGNGRAYALNDYEMKVFSLNCRRGEQICYGAWVTGDGSKYWGVGPNNRYSCRGCCATCGEGDVTPITLQP
jgi:hypothetical protein